VIDALLDLSCLDPRRDEARFEMLVSAINTSAELILAARRYRQSVMSQLNAWLRPMVAAGLAIIALSAGVLLHVTAVAHRGTNAPERIGAAGRLRTELALAVGLPEPLASTMAADVPPSIGDLLAGYER
jgi:hypothetical protein